ncbi:MAG TPA: 4-alpha-glucanotransferase, partial [Spirochaetia bacterium]|nr:4-alpha-glucanotransferase [Spirochaetia bacterium]
TPQERAYLDQYAPAAEPEVQWRLIRMALASVCRFAVVPLQNVRGLGAGARMNTPGTSSENNWSWRTEQSGLDEKSAARLRALSVLYGRARG